MLLEVYAGFAGLALNEVFKVSQVYWNAFTANNSKHNDYDSNITK